MRLKAKPTMTTLKTLSIRPFELKTSLETTTEPEIFRSRETKKVLSHFSESIPVETTKRVSSVETISPPSLTPITVTQVPATTSRLDLLHDPITELKLQYENVLL